MSLKRKSQTIEIDGDKYIVKEPTGSQIQGIFEAQESGKRIAAAYMCLKYALHYPDDSLVFVNDTVETMVEEDISPSVATLVTQVAMELVSPKKP